MILGYTIKKNSIIIFFKFYQNKVLYNKFIIYSKPSHKIAISIIKLKFIVQKNTQNIYFLSNFNGIFSHDFAIKNKIGGILLCKLII